MKMMDRTKQNMQPDEPMTLISLRLLDHVINDLKEVGPLAWIRQIRHSCGPTSRTAFASTWRKREAQRAKDSTVEEFSHSSLKVCQSRP